MRISILHIFTPKKSRIDTVHPAGSTLNRTSLIYCVTRVTLSSIVCRVVTYDICLLKLLIRCMCILTELKKLEVKRCGYFTSLTKFGFLTHLENLLKSTKLAVHFVCFFILLETFLVTSLFTHQKQYLQ